MKHLVRAPFFLIFFFSCIGVALYADSPLGLQSQEKQYFDAMDIAIDGSDIYIHSSNDWIKTNALRSDGQRFYVYGEDMGNCYGSRVQPEPKKWRCPYCNHWWLLGEKCKNEECPTNHWGDGK